MSCGAADVALQPHIGLSAVYQVQDLPTEEFLRGVAGSLSRRSADSRTGDQRPVRWLATLSIWMGLPYLRSTKPRTRSNVHDLLQCASPCPESSEGRTGRRTPDLLDGTDSRSFGTGWKHPIAGIDAYQGTRCPR